MNNHIHRFVCAIGLPALFVAAAVLLGGGASVGENPQEKSAGDWPAS